MSVTAQRCYGHRKSSDFNYAMFDYQLDVVFFILTPMWLKIQQKHKNADLNF